MPQDELGKLLNMFEDGSGFGDPDARRNAEQKIQIQILLAREQQRVAQRLNLFTLLLVVVGMLNVAVLAFQVWGREIVYAPCIIPTTGPLWDESVEGRANAKTTQEITEELRICYYFVRQHSIEGRLRFGRCTLRGRLVR